MRFEDYNWPIMPGHKPFAHQKATAAFAIQNKRCYILNDLGTGKTLSALWAADILIQAGKINRVLIVCPLSTMITTWCRDIAFNLPHRKYTIVHGSRATRESQLRQNAEFFIINHDGIKVMADVLAKMQFPLIIIDELTAFKTFSSDRTKAMFKLTRAAKGVWGMTGDPTPNSPLEAFGQAKVVNPFNPYLPPYFGQFKSATVQSINEYIEVPKPGAEEYVFKVLQPAIRFNRDDCVDLPECQTIQMSPALTDEQIAAYRAMQKELTVESEQGTITSANAAVKLSKLIQIAAGDVKGGSNEEGDTFTMRLDCSPRLNALYEIFQATPQKKLIVFCAFLASIPRVAQFLESKGLSVGQIHGGVSSNDRASLINQFQGGKLNVLVIQPQSTSHGVTLTAASTIVWYSLLPSNEIYTQANHRIIRIGQKRSQLIINFVSTPAERHYMSLLESKMEFSDDVKTLFDVMTEELA